VQIQTIAQNTQNPLSSYLIDNEQAKSENPTRRTALPLHQAYNENIENKSRRAKLPRHKK